MGVAETTLNGGFGVVLATPLAPWGWPSHPQYPLGVGSATPLGTKGKRQKTNKKKKKKVATIFFSFFEFFFKN
jgi:hypothetical protein